MDQQQMLERSHMLQSWRPDKVTLTLDAELTAPFCQWCADWHTTPDDHSLVTLGPAFKDFIPLECLLCPVEDWSADGTLLPGWTSTPDMGGELSTLCPTCTAQRT